MTWLQVSGENMIQYLWSGSWMLAHYNNSSVSIMMSSSGVAAGGTCCSCRGFSCQTVSRLSPPAVQASSRFFSVCHSGQMCPCVLSHSALWSSACTCRRSPRLSCRSWSFRPGTADGSSVSWCGQWRSATPVRHGGSRTSWCDRHRRSSWAASGRADTPQHTPAPWWGWRWCTGHQRCTWWTSAPCSPSGSGLHLRQETALYIQTVCWVVCCICFFCWTCTNKQVSVCQWPHTHSNWTP